MISQRSSPPELRDWLEIVIEENVDDLLRYLQRRVDNREDAADLLAHVLFALWKSVGRLPTTDEGARRWCYGIARNVLREHYRHASKQLGLADTLREQLRGQGVNDNAADTVAESNARAQRVRQAVMSLDERSRELVMLVHWDGFSIAEASRLLSINESTARTRHGRALQRLQRRLEDRNDESSVGRRSSRFRRRPLAADASN